MENNYSELRKYELAKKKVENIKAFYIHAVVFILCMPIIIVTNFMFVPGFHFFWLALLGWGIGIGIHAFVVFGENLLFGKEWEARKTEEFMKKNDRQFWE